MDATIYQTMKNAGEIEIVFDRGLKDRLKVILAIDNGGWSMDPYIQMVQTLFDYARAQFKDLKTYLFPQHHLRRPLEGPHPLQEPGPAGRVDPLRIPETRLILVGDASMAPYELMARDGSIYVRSAAAGPASASCSCWRKPFTKPSGSIPCPAPAGATPTPSA